MAKQEVHAIGNPIFFLITTQKFQLQIHYTLKVIAENVAISGIYQF